MSNRWKTRSSFMNDKQILKRLDQYVTKDSYQAVNDLPSKLLQTVLRVYSHRIST